MEAPPPCVESPLSKINKNKALHIFKTKPLNIVNLVSTVIITAKMSYFFPIKDMLTPSPPQKWAKFYERCEMCCIEWEK